MTLKQRLEKQIEKHICQAYENRDLETIYAIACGLVEYIQRNKLRDLVEFYENDFEPTEEEIEAYANELLEKAKTEPFVLFPHGEPK